MFEFHKAKMLPAFNLFCNKSIPIFIHELEQFLYRCLLPHELLQSEPPIKVPVYGGKELVHLIPAHNC